MKYLLPLFFLLPVLAFGQGKDSKITCTDERLLQAETLKKSGIVLPVFKHYCYSDQSGNYVLYLAEKQDIKQNIKQGEEKLSRAVEAHLLKIEADKSLSSIASIRDKANADEAGMEFWSKLTEIGDIDKDGNIESIIVYRFYNKGDDGLADRSAYSGRIKIVMLYKGSKVVIRAVTGDLDGERETTSTDNFFALPATLQKHLVQKMAAMYRDDQYGFDNSYQFKPVSKSIKAKIK
ncbi:M949_RS01915 family surface polysaccharide biosynthesis protein [Undibacterium sp. TC4M20W]|uniref:M949_RS01915 family surface polysaccharide biosynthesis protein n=1 Tax=Undibacterium sp. TC4M20W TaxID=3413052 RepID=UPI003BF28C3F